VAADDVAFVAVCFRATQMTEVLIGTAGWSYDDWAGYVYPPGASTQFDRLVYLAEMFDTLEVNSTFYHIPPARMPQSWVRRTAHLPKFTFSVKLFRGLTHERDESTRKALVSQFSEAMEPLREGGKLGAVLIQFPWSFRYTSENLDWTDRLIQLLKPLPLAIEVRHASWLNDDYLEYLSSHQIAFCNIDQPQLNQCLPPGDIVTADLTYVRLHGRNAAAWFAKDNDVSERYNYLYNSDELGEWADRIRNISGRGKRALVYTNNHFCGQAVANALQLKSILLNRRIAVPPHLVHAFPQLTKVSEVTEETSPPPQPQKTRRKSEKRPSSGNTRRGQTGWLFEDSE
jgi:uncharacterized protein YecE (DUF72 family)